MTLERVYYKDGAGDGAMKMRDVAVEGLGRVLVFLALLGPAAFASVVWSWNWRALDAGWATLMGSALGAGLTVWGAFLVSRLEAKRRLQARRKFVQGVVENVLLEAQMVEYLCRDLKELPVLETEDERIAVCKRQLEIIQHGFEVFERLTRNDGSDDDLHEKLGLVKLEKVINKNRKYLAEDVEEGLRLAFWGSASEEVVRGGLEFFGGRGVQLTEEQAKARIHKLFWQVRKKA